MTSHFLLPILLTNTILNPGHFKTPTKLHLGFRRFRSALRNVLSAELWRTGRTVRHLLVLFLDSLRSVDPILAKVVSHGLALVVFLLTVEFEQGFCALGAFAGSLRVISHVHLRMG